jgi:DNA-binding NtrC family response regulator
MISVLVIDDEPDVVDWMVDELKRRGLDAVPCVDPLRAEGEIRLRRPTVVVLDVEMPAIRGLDLMERLHRAHPDRIVVLMSGFATVDLAVEGLRRGAADFLTKPFTGAVLERTIRRAVDERALRSEVRRLRATRIAADDHGMVAASDAMKRILAQLDRVAPTGASVLITGESGVGKSALARRLHDRSDRASGPFVALNCAALPTSLVESELFGVKRGAFTDAREDRPGLLREAHGGTLFLDEIGDMPIEVQPKLLYAIETGRVRPVGGSGEATVDARIVAATHRDLRAAVTEGAFREDLLYRLDVLRVHVPPLRDRPDDLLPLIDVLFGEVCRRIGRLDLRLSRGALDALARHPWPGNVRELRNALERAAVLAEGETLLESDFARPEAAAPPDDLDGLLDRLLGHGLTLHELRDRYTDRVLVAHGDNKSEAARVLGIDRRTLYRR